MPGPGPIRVIKYKKKNTHTHERMKEKILSISYLNSVVDPHPSQPIHLSNDNRTEAVNIIVIVAGQTATVVRSLSLFRSTYVCAWKDVTQKMIKWIKFLSTI